MNAKEEAKEDAKILSDISSKFTRIDGK